jgi:hypothetical protein
MKRMKILKWEKLLNKKMMKKKSKKRYSLCSFLKEILKREKQQWRLEIKLQDML